jgi:hypothetical protein
MCVIELFSNIKRIFFQLSDFTIMSICLQKLTDNIGNAISLGHYRGLCTLYAYRVLNFHPDSFVFIVFFVYLYRIKKSIMPRIINFSRNVYSTTNHTLYRHTVAEQYLLI